MGNRKREISEARRTNAELYPIYKMFSWDLLFFYSIQFLFYTITKKVTASEVLIINGFYLFFRIICQLPAVMISDFFGKRKSIIVGNILLIFHILMLIFLPGAIGIIIADLIFSLGYDMKSISESNLLYESVSTKGGDGLYAKLDSRGGSWYYLLDAIASLMAGYLFVFNNYLPLIICMSFLCISTIISFKFKEINKPVKNLENTEVKNLKQYMQDLKKCFKFIFTSNRLRAFVIFSVFFYSIIKVVEVYRSDLLVDIGVPEEEFSIIFAVLNLISGISLSLRKNIEKKFKNRTLAFISLMFVGSCIVIGAFSSLTKASIIMPFILVMYAVQRISTATWWVLEYKYLKNFTKEKERNKLTFAYEVICGISASLFSVLGGLLIKVISIENAFFILGLTSLGIMVVILDYMRPRFGLRPKEYKKEDIEFDI